MYKILLAMVCLFSLSLISNLSVAGKSEIAEKPDWLEAEEFAKKKEKELLNAESALKEAKELADQKEEELRKAEIVLIREDYDLPPKN